jgi:hypothetical protein
MKMPICKNLRLIDLNRDADLDIKNRQAFISEDTFKFSSLILAIFQSKTVIGLNDKDQLKSFKNNF